VDREVTDQLEELRTYTRQFFSNHWRADELGPAPQWANLFPLAISGPYPNSRAQGCYALFADSELWYVGVGSSRGSGRYKGEGIGARIRHFVSVDWTSQYAGERIYRAKDKWLGVTHLSTIGFPVGTGYLAVSLEQFLLSKLDPTPPRNTCKPGSV
jgi:hypothetical protein